MRRVFSPFSTRTTWAIILGLCSVGCHQFFPVRPCAAIKQNVKRQHKAATDTLFIDHCREYFCLCEWSTKENQTIMYQKLEPAHFCPQKVNTAQLWVHIPFITVVNILFMQVNQHREEPNNYIPKLERAHFSPQKVFNTGHHINIRGPKSHITASDMWDSKRNHKYSGCPLNPPGNLSGAFNRPIEQLVQNTCPKNRTTNATLFRQVILIYYINILSQPLQYCYYEGTTVPLLCGQWEVTHLA